MAHDFVNFPELTDSQMNFYYFESPFPQIVDSFEAKVVQVHDGDTVTLETDFRNFPFQLRLSNVNAPEVAEGQKALNATKWLSDQCLDSTVWIKMDRDNRVGKYGRLIGDIICDGLSMSDSMLRLGLVEDFAHKDEGDIPSQTKWMSSKKWFAESQWH